MFISLPAIMLLVAALQLKFRAFTDHLLEKSPKCCNKQVLRAVMGLVSFMLTFFIILFVVSVYLFGLIWPELHANYNIDRLTFAIAIACTVPLLGIKFLALFAHGSEMKKLVVRTTSSECQFESALQLWLLLWIFQSTGKCSIVC